MISKIFNVVLASLLIVNLTLAAVYLYLKVPDVIEYGFEHYSCAYAGNDNYNLDDEDLS